MPNASTITQTPKVILKTLSCKSLQFSNSILQQKNIISKVFENVIKGIVLDIVENLEQENSILKVTLDIHISHQCFHLIKYFIIGKISGRIWIKKEYRRNKFIKHNTFIYL